MISAYLTIQLADFSGVGVFDHVDFEFQIDFFERSLLKGVK